MNKTLNTIVSVVAVVALVLGYVAYNKTPDVLVGSAGPMGPRGERGIEGPAGRDGVDGVTKVVTQVVEKPTLGAVSTPEFYFPASFYQGVTFSSVLATTSTGAGTLTYGDIKDKTTILSTNAGVLTLTMPASSTLTAFVPKAGDRVQMLVVNQGTALLTLAGGSGTLLQTASSTKTVNIGGSALLNFVRKTNTDIVVNMAPAI